MPKASDIGDPGQQYRNRNKRVLINPEITAKVVPFYQSGLSIRAVAGALNLSYGTVHRLVFEAGCMRPHTGIVMKPIRLPEVNKAYRVKESGIRRWVRKADNKRVEMVYVPPTSPYYMKAQGLSCLLSRFWYVNREEVPAEAAE
jgi:hypothetical protein